MIKIDKQLLNGGSVLRPTWDDYFLGLAFLASRRSRDQDTKHGAIIVNEHNHVIGTGYNSYPSGLDDSQWPTTRPEKYDQMRHAERNALDNMTADPNEYSKIYVTGRPCYKCACRLALYGIFNWVVADRKGFTDESMNDGDKVQEVIDYWSIDVKVVKPDLRWVFDKSFRGELEDLGFLDRS
jgi:dCMP deaminase